MFRDYFLTKNFKEEIKKKSFSLRNIRWKKLGQPFACDWYAEIDDKHVVFEFNGNHHYQSSFKILTDWRKHEVLSDPSRNHLEKNL